MIFLLLLLLIATLISSLIQFWRCLKRRWPFNGKISTAVVPGNIALHHPNAITFVVFVFLLLLFYVVEVLGNLMLLEVIFWHPSRGQVKQMPDRNKICLIGLAFWRGSSQADTSRCLAALFSLVLRFHDLLEKTV